LDENAREETLWARVLRNVAVHGYIELSVWDTIHKQIAGLEHMSQSHAEHMMTGQDLPQEHFDLLIKTWFFLETTQLDLIQQLKNGFSASPAVRAHCSQLCEPKTEDDMIGTIFTPKSKKKMDKAIQRTLKLFSYLLEAPKRQTLGVHTIVEALEHMLQKNPWAKTLTSAWVASCLSQLSIVTECVRQLTSFSHGRPRSKLPSKNAKHSCS
jgi:hypothetical protein